MSISAPMPVPLTSRDEEEQLRYAVMRSLEVNYKPESSNQDLSEDSSISGRRHRQEERWSMPTAAPYRRSRTLPNIVSPPCKSPNTPTLIPNPLRTRSVDWSAPKPTFSTDCCEVKFALLSENKEYLDNLSVIAANVISPLHVAVRKNHCSCIDEIIKGLPDQLSIRGTNGATPLFVAVSEDNLHAARRLVECGADVNAAAVGKETPLQLAIESGHHQMVRTLLRNGANPNQALNRGWTAIHESVFRGACDILKLIISHGGDPNVRDDFGVSPVFTSAACGRNECLDILLRAGGDPNLCSTSKAASPLYEACKEIHFECAMTLLRYAADPHLANCEGLYPLHIACSKGSIELVEELLKVTDKSLVENCWMSPVHAAAKEDEIDILELLIENGYNVNMKIAKDRITYRDRRQSALFFVVDNDSEEGTEILLKAGANTELDYVKALLVAISHGRYDIVDLLISHGADVNTSFADDGALFPAAIVFAIRDPRMLVKILLAGYNAFKCFDCAIGQEDHARYPESIQKNAFCHFLSQEKNLEWAGWTVLRVLGFVSNVKLCSRMREVLRSSREWCTIQAYTDQPRTLSHLCRLKIRECTQNSEEQVDLLPIPTPLISYIHHQDYYTRY